MPEATPRTQLHRFALPAALVAAFAAGAGLTWTLARPDAPAQQPEPPPTVAPPLPPPVLPAPPLGRAELLAATAAASAAYAAGAPPPADQAALVGRRFQIRVPFGCAGPQAEPAGAQAWWNYDVERETLTLTARPVVWTDAPIIPDAVAGQEVEAVEGFWIPRPWLALETCPPRPARLQPAATTPGETPAGQTPSAKASPAQAPAPKASNAAAAAVPAVAASAPAPSPQTVGLASLFKAGGSRVLRRGDRPYTVVRKMSPDDLAGRREFHLVLSGRIAALHDGQPAVCRAASPDQRPVCLVAVELERVAFEDAAGDMLAEWRS